MYLSILVKDNRILGNLKMKGVIYLTKYRIRKNSLQSNNLRNFYWIWKINKKYNKLNIIENLISLMFI